MASARENLKALAVEMYARGLSTRDAEAVLADEPGLRIRRGTFTSVAELEAAIRDWIDARNAAPKPFQWTAKAPAIIAKHRRAKKALAMISGRCK